MYHRFEENKYPSTNIRIKNFLKHLEIIKNENIQFVNPKNFERELIKNKNKRKVLLTIDDGFLSLKDLLLKEPLLPDRVKLAIVLTYFSLNWK